MLSTVRGLAGDAARSYSHHSGRMLASAVAFSALLSIAPLLFIAIGVASVAIGGDLGRASVHHDLGRWIGPDSADTIMGLLDHARVHGRSLIASIGGGVVLVYASTRLFSQIKRALNHMWNIQAKSGHGVKGKLWQQLRKRALALALVVFVGVLIIAVVAVKTVIAASTEHFNARVSGALFHGGEMLVSLATTTLMFAALFKTLPDARLHWRDAWRGALVTAVLFSIGTTLVGLYLGHKTLDMFYGPGGSLVLLLLWVQYSAQVFFFGAAVTGELARRRGHAIEPDDHGVRIVIEEGL
ncbi:MAG: YihY/virulence factor BrkB family protein [Kofleriaceae bacterium]